VAAQDAKLLAIGRPVEGQNLLGLEMGDLSAGTAVDGLNPDVIYAILLDRVGGGLFIWREFHTFGNSWISVEHARRTKCRGVEQGNLINARRACWVHDRHHVVCPEACPIKASGQPEVIQERASRKLAGLVPEAGNWRLPDRTYVVLDDDLDWEFTFDSRLGHPTAMIRISAGCSALE
jgi:hypothetical protein